jgi:hypothetical protein
MNWLRSEDLKEEKNVTAPIFIVAGQSAIAFGSLTESSCSAGKTPNLICIDQPAFRFLAISASNCGALSGMFGSRDGRKNKKKAT